MDSTEDMQEVFYNSDGLEV
jgi:hypothetical protein